MRVPAEHKQSGIYTNTASGVGILPGLAPGKPGSNQLISLLTLAAVWLCVVGIIGKTVFSDWENLKRMPSEVGPMTWKVREIFGTQVAERTSHEAETWK